MYFNKFLVPLDFALSIAVIVLTAYVFLSYREKENVFQLVDLDVRPEEEEYESKEIEKELESGYFYLVEAGGREKALKLFRHLTSKKPGLCFSREHPVKLKDKYNLKVTPLFWLSSEGSTDHQVNPTRLSLLQDTIMKFIQKNEQSVILVEDLEYLFFKNNFRKVMHLLEGLNDKSAKFSESTVIFSIDPDALKKRKLAIVEDEFDEIIKEEEQPE